MKNAYRSKGKTRNTNNHIIGFSHVSNALVYKIYSISRDFIATDNLCFHCFAELICLMRVRRRIDRAMRTFDNYKFCIILLGRLNSKE